MDTEAAAPMSAPMKHVIGSVAARDEMSSLANAILDVPRPGISVSPVRGSN